MGDLTVATNLAFQPMRPLWLGLTEHLKNNILSTRGHTYPPTSSSVESVFLYFVVDGVVDGVSLSLTFESSSSAKGFLLTLDL